MNKKEIYVLLKDFNRIGTYGKICKEYEWQHVSIDGKDYFKVDHDLYSVEEGQCIYNPSTTDMTNVVQDIFGYFGIDSTVRRSI